MKLKRPHLMPDYPRVDIAGQLAGLAGNEFVTHSLTLYGFPKATDGAALTKFIRDAKGSK